MTSTTEVKAMIEAAFTVAFIIGSVIGFVAIAV